MKAVSWSQLRRAQLSDGGCDAVKAADSNRAFGRQLPGLTSTAAAATCCLGDPTPPKYASPLPPVGIAQQQRRGSKMVASSGGPVLPFHKTFAASAIAACTAEIATLPLGEWPRGRACLCMPPCLPLPL